MRAADGNEKPAAEHAHAADRFAREIVGFLTVIAVRLRRLMGNPFGRWGNVVGTPFWLNESVASLNAGCARLRRAGACCAGVGGRPVVLIARCARCGRVRGVIPANARRARWFRAGVVRSYGWLFGTRDQRAEHAHAADRFAREIKGFLIRFAVRLRQLMGIPLARNPSSSSHIHNPCV
jgi:hypothetical protein